MLGVAATHQVPTAAQLLPLEGEVQVALAIGAARVPFGGPGSVVPDQDRSGAIVSFGNHAFEGAVFERVILGLDREPFVCRIEARTFWDGPAQ